MEQGVFASFVHSRLLTYRKLLILGGNFFPSRNIAKIQLFPEFWTLNFEKKSAPAARKKQKSKIFIVFGPFSVEDIHTSVVCHAELQPRINGFQYWTCAWCLTVSRSKALQSVRISSGAYIQAPQHIGRNACPKPRDSKIIHGRNKEASFQTSSKRTTGNL